VTSSSADVTIPARLSLSNEDELSRFWNGDQEFAGCPHPVSFLYLTKSVGRSSASLKKEPSDNDLPQSASNSVGTSSPGGLGGEGDAEESIELNGSTSKGEDAGLRGRINGKKSVLMRSLSLNSYAMTPRAENHFQANVNKVVLLQSAFRYWQARKEFKSRGMAKKE
jgi:hypothetical protein